jgi:hypothetical protein
MFFASYDGTSPLSQQRQCTGVVLLDCILPRAGVGGSEFSVFEFLNAKKVHLGLFPDVMCLGWRCCFSGWGWLAACAQKQVSHVDIFVVGQLAGVSKLTQVMQGESTIDIVVLSIEMSPNGVNEQRANDRKHQKATNAQPDACHVDAGFDGHRW